MTVGENGFGAPGSRRGAFSVGSTGAAGGGAVVVVVVVVEVSGAFSSSLAHDAVKAPIAAMAAIPATVEIRRSKRVMLFILSVSPAEEVSLI
jgi:hypothetical protein